MSKKNLGRTLVILSALLYGTMPFFAKKAYECGGNAVTTAFYRFALSLPILALLDVLTARKQSSASKTGADAGAGADAGTDMRAETVTDAAKLRLSGRDYCVLIVTGLLFLATPVLLFESYEYIGGGLATTLHFTFPVVVLILCRVFLRKKITLLKGACCLICVGGVLLMSAAGGDVHPLGLLFAGASALTYASYTVYFSKTGIPGGMSAFRHALVINLIGSAGILLLILSLRAGAFRLTPMGWLYTFGVSLGTGIGASLLYRRGIQLCGPQDTAIFSVLEPVTSVLLGVLFLNEKIGARSVAGIVLILGSILLLPLLEKKTRSAQS